MVLMSIACGAAVPGGLFMPSIMLGSSFGGLAGVQLVQWLPTWHIQPGMFSLIGATAVLGGVFRSSISLVRRASRLCPGLYIMPLRGW
jgi:chloride channel 7